MNALQAHQALTAAVERRAVPKATRRHIYLSDRPMVVVGYHLAGDPGAPVAIMWGTDPAQEPRCMVVPEPRNRALRFESLVEFDEEFLQYLSHFEEVDDDGLCLAAPQLVVPNPGTARWLTGIVGRFTRNLRTDGDAPVPPTIPLAGKYLSFFSSPLPGSSLVLVATDALTTHWQTGQLPAEDLNLMALLGWIDPPQGMDGPVAAQIGEQAPPAGPDSDPHWDAGPLSELIRAWHQAPNEIAKLSVRQEIDELAREQLRPAWDACWQARELLAAMPAADHVPSRWANDVRDWTAHSERVAQDRAFFRNIPTPTQAAARLKVVEDRTVELEKEMAWDDRLVMAVHVASGKALSGSVVAVDPTHTSPNANGRNTRRPLVTIHPHLETVLPVGTTLYLGDEPRVKLELVANDAAGRVRAQVIGGANTNATIGRLPSLGDEIVLSPFGRSDFFQRARVEGIPWTHLMPEDEE